MGGLKMEEQILESIDNRISYVEDNTSNILEALEKTNMLLERISILLGYKEEEE
jgi:hypothetical protein